MLIAAVVAVVVVAAAVGWSYLGDELDTISVTAQFDSAAGLYE
ncbi:mammalian cell entry protein, partial [Mycolicibacterium vaccae]|nr:mammalian cell entry protein [Mycolicibacterium vaccae]